MISAPDRQKAVELIDEARAAGARLKPACNVLGITARTYQRWTKGGQVRADRRPEACRPRPAHALDEQERQDVLDVCNAPEHASLPPGQIVPKLADEGRYVASESTFYRVLRAEDQQHHRGRARKPTPGRPPTTHCASAPNEVWCWDIERREALSDRATVRDHRGSAVAAAGFKLRAARPGERQQGWQAALTKPGHSSTVRCYGSGEQTRKV